VAAPAARVSALPAGYLLFLPLAGGRALGPHVDVLDAQSINCSEHNKWDRGPDGHKRTQCRKRQSVTGTSGLQRASHVGPAYENDRIGGQAALQNLAQQGCWRRDPVLADAGDDGQPLL